MKLPGQTTRNTSPFATIPIDETIMKPCIRCGVVKPNSAFKKDRKRCKDGTTNTCSECYRIADYTAKKLRKEWIQSGKKVPENCENCCRECKVVCDHDHETGELRGWLCDYCNRGIGALGDDIEGLEEAIKYLRGEKSLVEYIKPDNALAQIIELM